MNKLLLGTAGVSESLGCHGWDPALVWPALGYSTFSCAAGSGRSFAHLPSVCKRDKACTQPHQKCAAVTPISMRN